MNLHESILQKSNSYLCFVVGNEKFAIHVAEVTSILEMQQITTVPNTPRYMKGIINLRGAVLSVLDFRTLIGMEPTQVTSNTCILVIDMVQNSESAKVGMLVDSVNEVFEILPIDILPPPTVGMNHNATISGIANRFGEFVMLLEVANLFETQEKLSAQLVD